MKSFTEISPKRIGLIGVAIILAVVAAVIFTNKSLFSSGYSIQARFTNAAGVIKGTDVLVAGVKVGSVTSVQLEGNEVLATMNINNGVVLPHETAANIEVQTILGLVDLTLEPVSGWSNPLKAGALITDTTVPVELYQLQNTAGNVLAQTDAKALNNIVNELNAITAGKQTQVADIIEGLAKLTTTVSQRSGQVGQLIDSATTVSKSLSSQSSQLSSLVANLNTVANGLAGHSVDLANLIDNLDLMAGQTNSLVGQDEPQLNTLLQNLHSILGVVNNHQVDIAESVSYLAGALKGFASVGYSGANNTPNTWANVYANTVTIANGYGAIGPCGILDTVLNQLLGPDPATCSSQTGPLPGGIAASTSAAKSNSKGAAATSTTPAPNSGAQGLAEILAPLLQGLTK